jgi:hypothetical protein
MSDRATKLPIRLVPRRGGQILALVFSGFFFGFSVLWMASAAGIVDLDGEGFISRPADGGWIERLFPLFGLPFALIGIAGLARAVLKMLPGSPCYHLEISGRGLLVRSLFKQRRHAWAKLPEFRTIAVERRTKNGTRVEHYTVATETGSALADAPRNSAQEREVLRVFADEYGARNGKEDAYALTAWLNQLRERAVESRLDGDELVEVPEGFRASVISVAAAPSMPLAGRSAPVIQQSGKRDERPPTVVRR